MLSLSPVAHVLQYRNPFPNIRVLDVQSSTSDLTTYTFSGCNLGDFGGTASIADTHGTDALIRIPSKKAVMVVIHGEDAAATFGVDSVTIGGVAGTERYDRGGGTAGILVNTAVYSWTTDALQGITGTDIAVTFSEAVTSCAIGVLLVENILTFEYVGANAATGSGDLSNSHTGSPVPFGGAIYLAASTINANGEAAQFSFGTASSFSGAMPHALLYEGTNAEMGYACAWTYALHGPTIDSLTGGVSWSGTANADLICTTFRV